MNNYRIVRRYLNDRTAKVLKKGLKLQEAKEHCKNPETSSETCKTKKMIAHTQMHGPWFEAFEKQIQPSKF